MMIMILIGIVIGFLGYLMINNINLSVIEIGAQNKRQQLAAFIALTLLFESFYCFCSLYFLQFLMQYPGLIVTAQYLSVAFLFFIGLWSLFEKTKDRAQFRSNVIKRGYWSVFIHPQQIPFWFFWGIILINKHYLQTDVSSLLVFTLANVVGCFLILICYACYGNKIISLLNVQRRHLKNLVGIICIASACFLLYDIFRAA